MTVRRVFADEELPSGPPGSPAATSEAVGISQTEEWEVCERCRTLE